MGVDGHIRLWRSDRRDLSCRLASSPRTCTEKSIDTTNYSRQSSGIVLLPYSSVEICFLARFSAIQFGHEDFVQDYLVPAFTRLRDVLGDYYPDIFLILGNDDPRRCEEDFVAAAANGLWHYVHEQKSLWGISPSMALPTFRRPHFC